MKEQDDPFSTSGALFGETSHEELSLDRLPDYADLAAATRLWREERDRQGHLPAALAPDRLPRSLLPYVMLLEPIDAFRRLRIRMAGTAACAKHGGELRGKTTHDFFMPRDAETVVAAARRIATTREPSLARRSYVTLGGKSWAYVRLILPLSRDGTEADAFFKVLDPATMVEREGRLTPYGGRG